MKEIKLSQQGKNKGKFIALVDDEDFEYLNKFRWCASKDRNTFYAQRNLRVNGKQKTQKMHKLIMGDNLEKPMIDHRDGNGLNNQRSNLRHCTNKENGGNRKQSNNSNSPYKGVHLHHRKRKWYATINANGKIKFLGMFVSDIDAALAYNKAALEAYGSFARLNIIV